METAPNVYQQMVRKYFLPFYSFDKDKATLSTYDHAYRSVTVLTNPEQVNCDPELPGFALQMAKIW
jgi:hypothetical protein